LSKNTQTPNFIEISPIGAELFHAEGRTHMTKLTAAFRNFAKAPKRLLNSPTHQCPQYSIMPALRRLGVLFFVRLRIALWYRNM